MTKYIIKITEIAKDSNTYFAGDTHVYYYGKKEELIGDEIFGTSDSSYPLIGMDYFNFFVHRYGYNRECDAKKSWLYKNPAKNREFWEDEVIEIIKVEVN